MRMHRGGIALAVLALVGALMSACSSGSDEPIPNPLPTSSSASPAVQTYPGFLNAGGFGRSKPLTDLEVGKTGYIVLGLETFPYLKHKPNGEYCLLSSTPWWEIPGRKVGDVLSPHVAVKRTAVSKYTLITKPDDEDDRLEHLSRPLVGNCELSVTHVDTTLDARKILGFPADFTEGQVGYVPSDTIWVAERDSREGRLLSVTTSHNNFPGAVAIKKVGGNFQLLSLRAELHITSPEQMASEGMDEYERVLIPAS